MNRILRRLAGIILGVLIVCLVLYGLFLIFTEFSLEHPQTITIDVGDVTKKKQHYSGFAIERCYRINHSRNR